MCKNGFHVISRFRNDAVLYYPTQGRFQEGNNNLLIGSLHSWYEFQRISLFCHIKSDIVLVGLRSLTWQM